MRNRRENGFASVEMAITTPVLLLMIMAVGELGRACYQYNLLVKSVRDATRYIATGALLASSGVLPTTGLDTTKVSNAKNLVVYGNFTGSGSPILPGLAVTNVSVTSSQATQDVTVTVSYTYVPMFAVIPGFGVGSDFTVTPTLTASSEMHAL